MRNYLFLVSVTYLFGRYEEIKRLSKDGRSSLHIYSENQKHRKPGKIDSDKTKTVFLKLTLGYSFTCDAVMVKSARIPNGYPKKHNTPMLRTFTLVSYMLLKITVSWKNEI